jgi:hypothetical protein
MVTLGKRFSSSVAVAVAWVGGGGLAQLVYMGAVTALLRDRSPDGANASGAQLWSAVALPLTAALGGACSVGLMRLASGWPKINLTALFLCALFSAVPSLALLLFRNIIWVALAATLLGVAGVMAYTWGAASEGKLGTHMSEGATIIEEPEESGGN